MMAILSFRNYLNLGELQQRANSYRFIQFWQVIVILLACWEVRYRLVHADRDYRWFILSHRQVEGIARVIFGRPFSECVAIIQPKRRRLSKPDRGRRFPSHGKKRVHITCRNVSAFPFHLTSMRTYIYPSTRKIPPKLN